MKTKKRTLLVFAIAIAVDVLFIGTTIGTTISNQNKQQKLDAVDRNRAVNELYTLRGRILEIESLSHEEEIPSYVLYRKLDDLCYSHLGDTPSVAGGKNPYLQHLVFIVFAGQSESIGEACESFISQVDSEIGIINSDSKNE